MQIRFWVWTYKKKLFHSIDICRSNCIFYEELQLKIVHTWNNIKEVNVEIVICARVIKKLKIENLCITLFSKSIEKVRRRWKRRYTESIGKHHHPLVVKKYLDPLKLMSIWNLWKCKSKHNWHKCFYRNQPLLTESSSYGPGGVAICC